MSIIQTWARARDIFNVKTVSLAILAALATGSAASALEPVKFDRARAYLIWEDTGNLSKNIARKKEQIIANGEEGSSTQVLIDLVVSGEKNTVYPNPPMLIVYVTNPYEEHGPMMVDKGWSISYVGLKGESVRSIIVDHDCNPFVLHARVDNGETIGKEYEKTFNLTCGD
ncbi:MAG: hypothetical protein C0606_17125 [Hyphomicrobiales bacterium]|nr:MAG: hypothetical protein C0606_17125 [Hyphomicrobiales bacterium]